MIVQIVINRLSEAILAERGYPLLIDELEEIFRRPGIFTYESDHQGNIGM